MLDIYTKPQLATADRARLSFGKSSLPIYRSVVETLARRQLAGGVLLDVGCGCGDLWPVVADRFDCYCGADVIRYDRFPDQHDFYPVDLETGGVDLPDGYADVVVAIETIEHLENPRRFVRELTRLAKVDGWILVTTPNQLSLLSKLTLLTHNEFNAFRASNYPAHLTALLEVDLRRIADECGWRGVETVFSCSGRLPGMSLHWPGWLSRWLPRTLSDNVLIIGQKKA